MQRKEVLFFVTNQPENFKILSPMTTTPWDDTFNLIFVSFEFILSLPVVCCTQTKSKDGLRCDDKSFKSIHTYRNCILTLSLSRVFTLSAFCWIFFYTLEVWWSMSIFFFFQLKIYFFLLMTISNTFFCQVIKIMTIKKLFLYLKLRNMC